MEREKGETLSGISGAKMPGNRGGARLFSAVESLLALAARCRYNGRDRKMPGRAEMGKWRSIRMWKISVYDIRAPADTLRCSLLFTDPGRESPNTFIRIRRAQNVGCLVTAYDILTGQGREENACRIGLLASRRPLT